MRLQRFIVGLVMGLLWLPMVARAIVIETPTGRRAGYFVRDDGKKLFIRQRTADGKEQVSEYDRSKVKIIHQIDSNRLRRLSPENPEAYQNYAEELAKQNDDPESRDMAMRLFLIAAYLEPKKLGPSCLLAVSDLAVDPAEARRCRALAFVLDSEGDAGLLKKAGPLPRARAEALQEFLKAMAYFRAGQIESARQAASREGVDVVFTLAPGMVDRKTFLQRCTDVSCPSCGGKGKVQGFGRLSTCTKCEGVGVMPALLERGLPDDILRNILRAELWAMDQLTGGDSGAGWAPAETSWTSLLEARKVSPVAPLSLETITEFDPRKCLYRNGAWVAPSKE